VDPDLHLQAVHTIKRLREIALTDRGIRVRLEDAAQQFARVEGASDAQQRLDTGIAAGVLQAVDVGEADPRSLCQLGTTPSDLSRGVE
jgi:hypothetical protein